MSTNLQHFKKDFLTLVEAGFIAVNNTDEDSAVKLFKAAEILQPENSLPKVGFGYMHMCKLELKQAASSFRSILEKEPTNEMARAFLGICLTMTPTELAKGENILDEIEKSSHDSGIKKLASTAKDFMNKFIKKSPSPVEPQAPKHKDKTKKN